MHASAQKLHTGFTTWSQHPGGSAASPGLFVHAGNWTLRLFTVAVTAHSHLPLLWL